MRKLHNKSRGSQIPHTNPLMKGNVKNNHGNKISKKGKRNVLFRLPNEGSDFSISSVESNHKQAKSNADHTVVIKQS
jgi:hypothetical protein